MQANPQVRQLKNAVYRAGRYDGSVSQQRIAENKFNSLSQLIGCSNPATRSLYWEILEADDLPISLAAAVAFAVGEYVQNPMYQPGGANMQSATMMYAIFPELEAYLDRNMPQSQKALVAALTANFIEDVI